MEIIDQDILQIKDETNKKWVKAWKKEVLKKQKFFLLPAPRVSLTHNNFYVRVKVTKRLFGC